MIEHEMSSRGTVIVFQFVIIQSNSFQPDIDWETCYAFTAKDSIAFYQTAARQPSVDTFAAIRSRERGWRCTQIMRSKLQSLHSSGSNREN